MKFLRHKENTDRERFTELRNSARESIKKNRMDWLVENKQTGESIKKERERFTSIIKQTKTERISQFS